MNWGCVATSNPGASSNKERTSIWGTRREKAHSPRGRTFTGHTPPNRPRRKVRPSSDGAEDCFGEIRVGPVSDPTLSVWRRRGREPVPETGESGSLVGMANLEVISPGVQAYLLHLACPSWFGICETLCSACKALAALWLESGSDSRFAYLFFLGLRTLRWLSGAVRKAAG